MSVTIIQETIYFEPISIRAIEQKTVQSIHINDSRETLAIQFTDGTQLHAQTMGDCCSESWWADVYTPQQIIGSELLAIHTLEQYYPNDDRSRQEEDKAYGFSIVGYRGLCTIVFRNSSNGYYGGDCSWVLLSGDDVVDLGCWTMVVDDWSA